MMNPFPQSQVNDSPLTHAIPNYAPFPFTWMPPGGPLGTPPHGSVRFPTMLPEVQEDFSKFSQFCLKPQTKSSQTWHSPCRATDDIHSIVDQILVQDKGMSTGTKPADQVLQFTVSPTLQPVLYNSVPDIGPGQLQSGNKEILVQRYVQSLSSHKSNTAKQAKGDGTENITDNISDNCDSDMVLDEVSGNFRTDMVTDTIVPYNSGIDSSPIALKVFNDFSSFVKKNLKHCLTKKNITPQSSPTQNVDTSDGFTNLVIDQNKKLVVILEKEDEIDNLISLPRMSCSVENLQKNLNFFNIKSVCRKRKTSKASDIKEIMQKSIRLHDKFSIRNELPEDSSHTADGDHCFTQRDQKSNIVTKDPSLVKVIMFREKCIENMVTKKEETVNINETISGKTKIPADATKLAKTSAERSQNLMKPMPNESNDASECCDDKQYNLVRIGKVTALECKVCKECFIESKEFYKHLSKHQTVMYFCQSCKHEFTSVDELYIHLAEKTMSLAKDKFICPCCHKTYSDIESFTTHLPEHISVKSFLCPVCRWNFNDLEIWCKHFGDHLRQSNECNAKSSSAKEQKLGDFSEGDIIYIGDDKVVDTNKFINFWSKKPNVSKSKKKKNKKKKTDEPLNTVLQEAACDTIYSPSVNIDFSDDSSDEKCNDGTGGLVEDILDRLQDAGEEPRLAKNKPTLKEKRMDTVSDTKKDSRLPMKECCVLLKKIGLTNDITKISSLKSQSHKQIIKAKVELSEKRPSRKRNRSPDQMAEERKPEFSVTGSLLIFPKTRRQNIVDQNNDGSSSGAECFLKSDSDIMLTSATCESSLEIKETSSKTKKITSMSEPNISNLTSSCTPVTNCCTPIKSFKIVSQEKIGNKADFYIEDSPIKPCSIVLSDNISDSPGKKSRKHLAPDTMTKKTSGEDLFSQATKTLFVNNKTEATSPIKACTVVLMDDISDSLEKENTKCVDNGRVKKKILRRVTTVLADGHEETTDPALSVTDKTSSVTNETLSVTNETLSITNETLSITNETLSVADETLSVENGKDTFIKKTLATKQQSLSTTTRRSTRSEKRQTDSREMSSESIGTQMTNVASANVEKDHLIQKTNVLATKQQSISTATRRSSCRDKRQTGRSPMPTENTGTKMTNVASSNSENEKDNLIQKTDNSLSQVTTIFADGHEERTNPALSIANETLSVANETLSVANETLSVADETLSLENDKNTPKKTSATKQQSLSTTTRSTRREKRQPDSRQMSTESTGTKMTNVASSNGEKDNLIQKTDNSLSQVTTIFADGHEERTNPALSIANETLSVANETLSVADETLSVADETLSLENDKNTPKKTSATKQQSLSTTTRSTRREKRQPDSRQMSTESTGTKMTNVASSNGEKDNLIQKTIKVLATKQSISKATRSSCRDKGQTSRSPMSTENTGTNNVENEKGNLIQKTESVLQKTERSILAIKRISVHKERKQITKIDPENLMQTLNYATLIKDCRIVLDDVSKQVNLSKKTKAIHNEKDDELCLKNSSIKEPTVDKLEKSTVESEPNSGRVFGESLEVEDKLCSKSKHAEKETGVGLSSKTIIAEEKNELDPADRCSKTHDQVAGENQNKLMITLTTKDTQDLDDMDLKSKMERSLVSMRDGSQKSDTDVLSHREPEDDKTGQSGSLLGDSIEGQDKDIKLRKPSVAVQKEKLPNQKITTLFVDDGISLEDFVSTAIESDSVEDPPLAKSSQEETDQSEDEIVEAQAQSVSAQDASDLLKDVVEAPAQSTSAEDASDLLEKDIVEAPAQSIPAEDASDKSEKDIVEVSAQSTSAEDASDQSEKDIVKTPAQSISAEDASDQSEKGVVKVSAQSISAEDTSDQSEKGVVKVSAQSISAEDASDQSEKDIVKVSAQSVSAQDASDQSEKDIVKVSAQSVSAQDASDQSEKDIVKVSAQSVSAQDASDQSEKDIVEASAQSVSAQDASDLLENDISQTSLLFAHDITGLSKNDITSQLETTEEKLILQKNGNLNNEEKVETNEKNYSIGKTEIKEGENKSEKSNSELSEDGRKDDNELNCCSDLETNDSAVCGGSEELPENLASSIEEFILEESEKISKTSPKLL